MSTATQLNDRQLVAGYTDQPECLPENARVWAIQHLGPIEAYAFVDLDGSLDLCESWAVLGQRGLGIMSQNGWSALPNSDIERARFDRGLSCNTVVIDRHTRSRSWVLYASQRQRRAHEYLVSRINARVQREEEVPPPSGGDADQSYVRHVAGPIREAQALVTPSNLTVIWRLLSYLTPYRAQVFLGTLAAAFITLLALVPPFLTGYLIDDVIRPAQSGTPTFAGTATLAWLAVFALATVYVLRRAAAWVRLRVMAMIGEYVARDLRAELFRHLQKLSLSFYSRKKTGSLITRVSSDTDRLWEFLALGVVDVSLSAVMLIGLSSVLMYLDWRLGLLMTLPVPILIWGIHHHGRRMRALFLRAWRKWSQLTDVLGDTIPGMRVVKAFDQHGREIRRFEGRNSAIAREFIQIHRVWTSFWPALMLCVELSIVGVWAFALPRLLHAHSVGPISWAGPPLSLGVFVSFLLYTTMFTAPIEIIGQMTRIMHRATTSAHRVFEVLDTEADVVDKDDPKRLQIRGRVSFDHVSFSYDGTRPILRDISFDVRPGEMIGLVGPSGGGKTTITNLIARLYDASSGSVMIDGVDVRQLDSGALRRKVAMVLQDPYLFHGSVLDNIRYGRPNADRERVIRAARVANAHDFICKLPHGYDTVVGERGHTLSGGERQRLSIARAVLTNPRILILDEATSSVDTETEHKIQQAMERLVQGRTVFAIAHRLSTLRTATRLFVIDDGRIVESGTHAELSKRPSGLYRKLHELQQQLSLGV